jgi:hypothetical protein
MTIEFETTLDDLVEFNLDHICALETTKAARSSATLRLFLMGLVIGVLLAVVGRKPLYVLAGVAGGTAGIIAYRSTWESSARERVVKILSRDTHDPVVWHRMTLQPDGLLEESESGLHQTKYASVKRIVEGEKRVYVYVEANLAHVIARERVKAGDLEAFISALRQRMPAESR